MGVGVCSTGNVIQCLQSSDCRTDHVCLQNNCVNCNETCEKGRFMQGCVCEANSVKEGSKICTTNEECARNETCINKACLECSAFCGEGTTCETVNHTPTCRCKSYLEGQPLIACNKL